MIVLSRCVIITERLDI